MNIKKLAACLDILASRPTKGDKFTIDEVVEILNTKSHDELLLSIDDDSYKLLLKSVTPFMRKALLSMVSNAVIRFDTKIKRDKISHKLLMVNGLLKDGTDKYLILTNKLTKHSNLIGDLKDPSFVDKIPRSYFDAIHLHEKLDFSNETLSNKVNIFTNIYKILNPEGFLVTSNFDSFIYEKDTKQQQSLYIKTSMRSFGFKYIKEENGRLAWKKV